ncbi:hypothetical protein BUALT_Bualt07G0046900 [Buddleja alternifolia]|uniref:DDB1- and CUL4-associated factor 12 beta-propeller domain-containing protein n=1 Tax=Buddleja alternifolia TaxID=168488 RepID=A0AAV6X896_9LAMI|nr:hypothetical protein BUALT_Bualt07G0046900 [Buddleja alternifolia]
MSQSDQTCTSRDHSSSLAPPPPYLHAHHQCIATLKGQNSYTSSLLVTGKFLVTGSSNKEIRLQNRDAYEDPTNDNNLVVAGNGAVKALIASADKIISAHQDHKIRVWKIDVDQKFAQLHTLPTLGDRAIKLLLPRNHIQIRRHKTCTWVHHVDTVSALALSSDETLLYSVSWDRSLKIWRTSDFKCLESVANAHDDAINAITVSDDNHVYTGSSDNKIKVWKKSEKKHSLVAILEKHDSGVNALAISNMDGMILYSGGSDGSILVWRDEGGGSGMVVVGPLRGHTKSILCLAVVLDLVCSGSADKTVRIWRGFGNIYSCLAVLEGHKGPVKCIAVTFDHSPNVSDAISTYILYSASLDCDIKVWKVFCPSILTHANI